MKVVFTRQAILSLLEALEFLSDNVSNEKLFAISDAIILRTDILKKNPYAGQAEVYLEHLGLGHRRLIIGNYRIIYRIE